jgi:hypothetical protein
MLTGENVQVEKLNEDSTVRSYVKGTLERVLAKCRHNLVDVSAEPTTEAFQVQYNEAHGVRFLSPPLHIEHVEHTLMN